MVSPVIFEDVSENVVTILPPEIASKIVTIAKAIGGLMVLYLIFVAIRLFMIRKQVKKIEEIKEDVEKIKRKLGIKN